MVEHLREFKISMMADSNKQTVRQTWNLDHYESIDEMLEAVNSFLKDVKENGVMNAFWGETR